MRILGNKNIILACSTALLLLGCVDNDDGTATVSTDTTTATVTGDGDGLSVSQASDIIVDDDNINLDGAFSVRVVNSGSPVPNAVVTISLTATQFFKGAYVAGTDSYSRIVTVTCPAETAGTDTNGNGNIDPAGTATITAHPTLTPTISSSNTVTTNSDGEAYFSLRYSRDVATWAEFTLTAVTVVDGVSITVTRENLVPSQLASELTDVETGFAGQTSPYGTSMSCNDIM